jgi:hypothetical protein
VERKAIEGLLEDTLQIASDDPDEGFLQVELFGTGVVVEPPPDEQIAEILEFFDDAVSGGSLVGDGPGGSADGRLGALRNMIEAAGDLINDGLVAEACDQLLDVQKRADGEPRPPDFVTGADAEVLFDRVQVLRDSLGCS